MTVTNRIAQTRLVRYKLNGVVKTKLIQAYGKLSIPELASINQVIFSARDQALRNANSSRRTSFVTTFTFA